MNSKKSIVFTDLFYLMAEFAKANGMKAYESDLMHDAITLFCAHQKGQPFKYYFLVKSNGCGTIIGTNKDWVFGHDGARALIEFDESYYYFTPLIEEAE